MTGIRDHEFEKRLILKQKNELLRDSVRTVVKIELHHEKTIFFFPSQNKGADQLCSNCEADQRLCFRYTDSTIPLLLKYQIKFKASSLLL